MRSETVCEKWEAKRKDLFNKLRRSCGCNQILKKNKTKEEGKDARRETHTYKDENQNLQIPKTENQKRQKNNKTERKALVQKDFAF